MLSVLLGARGVWETLAFSWYPTFQAPALRYGPTHANHHAFRESTLTLGALAVILWAMFQPAETRMRPLWVTMAFAAACYNSGWWLPWPPLGLRTPNLAAELVHIAAALVSGAVIALSLPNFHHGDRRDP